MDSSTTTIVLVVLSVFVFVGVISVALFITSDDFKDYMAEADEQEEAVKAAAPVVMTNQSNSSTQIIQKLSWKKATVQKVLGAMGFDTEKKDSAYESRAMVYATTRMVTLFLVLFGVIIGGVTAVFYLNQQFNKTK